MTRNNADFQGGYGGVGEHKIINYFTGDKHVFQMHDSVGNLLGHLELAKDGTIGLVETHPEVRRRGIATALYNAAKEASAKNPAIPTPQQSTSRTDLGSKWAKAITTSENAPLPKLKHRLSKDRYEIHWAISSMQKPLKRNN